MVMTIDFLTSFRDESVDLLVLALEKKGLTVNVIGSFNDINNGTFLIIWDPTLVPSQSKFISNRAEHYPKINCKNFSWIMLEEWRYLHRAQKTLSGFIYPLLIIPRNRWSVMIENLKKIIDKGNYIEYLVVPSFAGNNDSEDQRQIVNSQTGDDLKVSSEDGFLLVYPWTEQTRKLFRKEGILSLVFMGGRYHSAYRKKVHSITDLVDETSRQKTRPPFFVIRMAELVIHHIKDVPLTAEDPIIQIDFYPVGKLLEWTVGRIHLLAHDNFLAINPKLANQWSTSIAKEFPEYREKRKKFLGLF